MHEKQRGNYFTNKRLFGQQFHVDVRTSEQSRGFKIDFIKIPFWKSDDFASALGLTTEQFLNVKSSPTDTTSNDIDNIIDNAMMFDGKPLTDDDKRAIRGIIAGYMSSKEK